MKQGGLWLNFVRLSLACAIIPGFGLALFMTGAWAAGAPRGLWYLASVQTHAVALLSGWGGAMILGVALHFLPRLRGVKLLYPQWAAAMFWVLVCGLVLRIAGQLADSGASVAVSNTCVAAGVALQTTGTVALIFILAATLRSGRPLRENKGFAQIVPLLAVAALALVLAQVAWFHGVSAGLRAGTSLAILPAGSQRAAADLMLFGFVMAIAAGMSARLFPLTFRTQLAHVRGLHATAALLAAGVISNVLELTSAPPPTASWSGWAAAFYGAGILAAAFSVKVFHRRKVIPHSTVTYHVLHDPAAVGAYCAYVWALLAAAFLLIFALQQAGLPMPAQAARENLARHAMGAGFMTLLIISVGWKMLPGFGGCLPCGGRLLWGAVILGNAAALLRVLSILAFDDIVAPQAGTSLLLPLAGLAGLGAVLFFIAALRKSYRDG